MAYYDPYYQDPYGGYDPYGYDQTFDESPPPEENEDWEDVPKTNRLYARKINNDVIHEDFNHLKSENLFSIEAMVDHVELNEELVTKLETKEKLDDKIVTSVKMLNLPYSELSFSRDDGTQKTVISEQSSRHTGKQNTVISEKNSRITRKEHTVISEKPSRNAKKQNTVISKQSSKNHKKKNTVNDENPPRNSRKQSTVISEKPSKTGGKQNTVISEGSITSNVGKLNTVISERSAVTLPIMILPPMSEYFQTMLSRLVKIAGKYEKDPEREVVEEDEGEYEGTEDKNQEEKATLKEKQDEQIEEETTKRVKIDVKKGNSVLMLTTGFSLIQKLQTQDVRVAVARSDVIDTEEGEITDVVPLGSAVIRFSLDFYQAVLRREATESYFSVPLVDEEGTEVGVVDVSVTLVSLGQGVEVEMREGPGAYGRVKLIDTFTPEAVQSIFDPPVHPRLAVTLLNMEPPLGLNRTSTEIINACLESKLSSEGEEGSLYSKYKPRKCRWLEIAKEKSLKNSKLSLSSRGSVVSKMNKGSLVSSRLPGKSDPELHLLWGKLKRQCKELWEEAEEAENKKRSLYEDLDELLLQDKGDGWEDKAPSETSAPNQEEDQTSETSKRSERKSTVGSTVKYDETL